MSEQQRILSSAYVADVITALRITSSRFADFASQEDSQGNDQSATYWRQESVRYQGLSRDIAAGRGLVIILPDADGK